jgi:ssDNA-binding Zn-finger/Zn-ribbon topoisomerase 1
MSKLIPPVCPHCKRDLVLKSKKSRRPFWACPGYPECVHTEPVHESYIMRQIGHPELPLFEEDTAAAADSE